MENSSFSQLSSLPSSSLATIQYHLPYWEIILIFINVPSKRTNKKKKSNTKDCASTGVHRPGFTISRSFEWIPPWLLLQIWMWSQALFISNVKSWKFRQCTSFFHLWLAGCSQEPLSINSLGVIRPWREGNSVAGSLYVPLVFLTSIDPPAFRPCWCMNRMKAALKEPVTDIKSPQTFISLPFILLLKSP